MTERILRLNRDPRATEAKVPRPRRQTLRERLLEQRAELAGNIAEAQDRVRHLDGALAALDAAPDIAEALGRVL